MSLKPSMAGASEGEAGSAAAVVWLRGSGGAPPPSPDGTRGMCPTP